MKLITDQQTNGLVNPEFREYLKTRVEKTEFTTEEIDSIRETLSSALDQFGGLGIAATQLGIKKRACFINIDGDELLLINPQITERSDEGFIFIEGCLSIPKTIKQPLKTIRSTKVVVQTDNLGELTFEINKEGDKDSVSKETMQTVVVQHEIDHLDGITIRDRVYSTTIVKNEKWGRNDKVIMKSPKGELVEIKYKRANDYFLQGYEIV
jgi:peptide deformylase